MSRSESPPGRTRTGTGVITTPDRVDKWRRVEAARLPADAMDLPDIGQLAELRDALGGLFTVSLDGTSPPPASLLVVNAASRAGAGHLELEWTVRGVRARTRPSRPWAHAGSRRHAPSRSRPIGYSVGCRPRPARLRRCEGSGCTLLFVATNLQRRWCAPYLCGNRTRVARHYRRTRDGRVRR